MMVSLPLKFEGKTYMVNPEHETCPIAKGFAVKKIKLGQYEIVNSDNPSKQT
jgi:hypothetical protein